MRRQFSIGSYQVVWYGSRRDPLRRFFFEKLSGGIYEWRRAYGPIDIRKWAPAPPIEMMTPDEYEAMLRRVRDAESAE